jgi:hypothetical protein
MFILFSPHARILNPTFYSQAMAATVEEKLKQIFEAMNELVARQHFAFSLLQPMEYALCQQWLKCYHGQIHSAWMVNSQAG